MNYFLLLSVVFCLQLVACQSKQNVVKPLRKDIKQAVYASGKVYPQQRRLLAIKASGYVKQVFAQVGDSVAAGMPLVAVANELATLNEGMAQRNLNLATESGNSNSSAVLQLAQQDVSSTASKYALDSANAVRFANLLQQNATSKLLAEQAKTQADISKQNLQKARLQLQNLQTKLDFDIKNAQTAYKQQQSIKNDFVLYADAPLRVYDVRVKVGELVSPQVPLVEAGNSQIFEVELAIDESDVGLVQTGQDIVFELSAKKNTFLSGKVQNIYPSINLQNKTAKVVASIANETAIRFFSGMSVEANIVVAEKKNALVIARNYLFDNDYVKLASTKQKTKIEKGIEDLDYVEILGGIDENTEITDSLE
jgi:HlyD family secretion protein